MPDPILGERVCAFVVPRSANTTLTLSDLTSYLLEHGIAKFKLPERLELVDDLPMSRVGKVSKMELTRRIKEKVLEEQQR
jgi:non-ribosomal peptide synthetase component E (peptide arylation enzyme)